MSIEELSPERALEILRGMDSGEIEFNPARQRHPCHVRYAAWGGIIVTIFDDGGEWDYVDEIHAGYAVWNPENPLDNPHREIFHWEPKNWIKWENPTWDDTDHSGPKGLPSNATL